MEEKGRPIGRNKSKKEGKEEIYLERKEDI